MKIFIKYSCERFIANVKRNVFGFERKLLYLGPTPNAEKNSSSVIDFSCSIILHEFSTVKVRKIFH